MRYITLFMAIFLFWACTTQSPPSKEDGQGDTVAVDSAGADKKSDQHDTFVADTSHDVTGEDDFTQKDLYQPDLQGEDIEDISDTLVVDTEEDASIGHDVDTSDANPDISADTQSPDVSGDVDETPPDAPVLSALPPLTNQDTIVIEGTAEIESAVTIYVCSLDTFGDCSGTDFEDCKLSSGVSVQTGSADDGTFSFNISLNEGTNCIFVVATDASQNVSEPASTSIDRDSGSSDAPVLNPEPPPYTNKATVILEGTVSEGMVELKIVKEGFESSQSETILVGINNVTTFNREISLYKNQQNIFKLSARITTDFGNVTVATVIHDDIPPTSDFVIESPADNLKTNNPVVFFKGNGFEPEVFIDVDISATVDSIPKLLQSIYIANHLGNWPQTDNVTLFYKNGAVIQNTIDIQSRDKADNTSAKKTVTVTIDQDPPLVPTVSFPSFNYAFLGISRDTFKPTLTISGTSGGGTAVVWMKDPFGVNQSSAVGEGSPFTFADVGLKLNNANQISFWDADDAGNTSNNVVFDFNQYNCIPPGKTTFKWVKGIFRITSPSQVMCSDTDNTSQCEGKTADYTPTAFIDANGKLNTNSLWDSTQNTSMFNLEGGNCPKTSVSKDDLYVLDLSALSTGVMYNVCVVVDEVSGDIDAAVAILTGDCQTILNCDANLWDESAFAAIEGGKIYYIVVDGEDAGSSPDDGEYRLEVHMGVSSGTCSDWE